MREFSPRSSSSFHERGDFRAGHVKSNKPTHTRPMRSVNLSRLGDELGLDVLGAALGLTDEALGIVIQGRGHVREDQYLAHLVHRLKEAGLPAGWTETDDAPLRPEYLKALREFAAAATNKAPIRRANFKRLAKAFNGRADVLAAALDMVAPSISNVAEGRLEFDDGRFGHVNPQLMQAGFPDGWLEQAEPVLTDAMLTGLEQAANDSYERELADADDDLKHTEGQTFVGSTEKSVQPVAAPVDTSQETVMATANPRQAKSTTATATTAPFKKPTPNFAAAGTPGGPRPMAHPTAGAKIPRTVMAGGRKIGGDAAPVARKTAAAAPSARQAAPAKTPAVKAAPPAAKKAAPQKAAAPAAKKTAPATKTASAPAKKAPVAQAELLPMPEVRGSVTKEESLARAEALNKLLNGARRGTKVTLWRDILGPGLAYWGNIRRGAVLFRDELAQGAIKALGLPTDWFENPTFPPKTLAPWVVDPNAPVPTALEAGIQQQGAPVADGAAASEAPKATYPKPFARKTAPRPGLVTTTKAPTSAPVLKAPVFTPPAQADLLAASPAQPAAAAPVAQPAAAVAAPAVAAPAVATPPGHHSPMVSALLALIDARASAGTLSDTAAMQLIHTLSAV
jgi:chemotaxis protein histidine kinase CheA